MRFCQKKIWAKIYRGLHDVLGIASKFFCELKKFQNRNTKNMKLVFQRFPYFFMHLKSTLANVKRPKTLFLHTPAREVCMPEFMLQVVIFFVSTIFYMSSILQKTFWVKKMKNKIFERFEIFNIYNFHPFFPIMVLRAFAQQASREVYMV